MQLSSLQMTVLFVAGLTACAIGTIIAVNPQAFYLSYGIDLRGNVDLLSELRAPGTNLAALGGLMLAGLFKPWLRPTAAIAGMLVFTAFSAGRVFGIILDGMPSAAIQLALGIEMTLAIACFIAFRFTIKIQLAKKQPGQ